MRVRGFIALLGICFGLLGCGIKELPKMKAEADQALKDVMVQYRLRADIVPQLLKLVEGRKDAVWAKQIPNMVQAHRQAVGIDIPPEQLDEIQINRMISFQTALSTALVDFNAALEADKKINRGEHAAVKEQLSRAESRIAAARSRYQELAPHFNESLNQPPQKWWNQWFHKLKPALLLP
ncbi:MAG: LemA family protein [Bdellovibrionales bacterium]